MNVLSDPASERGLLAGIFKHGYDAYLDIADIVQSSTFTIDSNVVIYKCVEHIFKNHENTTIDIASIYSAAHAINLSNFFEKKTENEHLQAIFRFPVDPKNVRKFAAKIRKLHIARVIRQQLEKTGDEYLDITGDESLTHILGIAENSIFDLSELINDKAEEPELLGEKLVDYVKYLGENPVEQLGLSTGFKNYDKSIGGGLRNSAISIIAGRPKCGKSLIGNNIGYNIASQNNLPVLYLDTEMTKKDYQHRTLAMMTESSINDIETGKYIGNDIIKNKVVDAAQKLQNEEIPYYYISIAGLPFEEQLAIMRRWLAKRVGFKDNGKANGAVIVYDYLKLMSSEKLNQNLQEYQALGFMMTSLHNFAVRYDIPILALMQLNRDGITRESTDVASGSDRIIWLCSNFTIFKRKSDEEIAEDGNPELGNMKLVPIISRHGSWDERNYINCHMKGWCAKITEGLSKFESLQGKKLDNIGFEIDDENEPDSEIEFN